jgi:tetratricopeptide (TPR) repeat protein
MRFQMVLLLAAVLWSCGLNSPVFADDVSARQKFEEAQNIYKTRGEWAYNEALVQTLDQAFNEAEDADLKYDILILKGRTYYWAGGHAQTKQDKMKFYDLGMAVSKQATDLNEEYAEGFYTYGLNLAKWALTKGVLESLFRKDELIGYCNSAIDRQTSKGEPGVTTDTYGPDRILGYMYYKLPGFAGGSHNKAVKTLKEAVDNGSNLALNIVYYAEVLYDGNASEQALARKLLDDLLSKNPDTYNLDRIPECREEFATARELRKAMGR